MYRLAMELGLMDAELESDHAKISNRMGAYSTGLNSDNIREILDALDEDGQRLMLDIAVGLDGLAGSNRRALVRTLSVEHLLSLGLLSDYPLDFSDAGISFRKGDVRAALVSAGISVPDDRLKKGSRQEKDRQYLSALQQSGPATLENLFAVVDGTALAYDRRNVIFSYLSKKLTEE
jgi:hypothetical protein